ncbi:Spt4/RpoE2 zinc finger-domain-containing protein [Hypoxylon sp. NC1633]|nr:Spt4/RpoE2 zinc finger-domain-containing protein [Hypoxylon sp. NC1633]
MNCVQQLSEANEAKAHKATPEQDKATSSFNSPSTPKEQTANSDTDDYSTEGYESDSSSSSIICAIFPSDPFTTPPTTPPTMAPQPYTAIASNQLRYSRACMVCSIIMTQAKFRSDGCPNCPFLDLKGSPEAIESCTSGVYEGTIAMIQPKTSWMSRWVRIDSFVPGVYALKVMGSLPEDVKQALEEDGHVTIPHRPKEALLSRRFNVGKASRFVRVVNAAAVADAAVRMTDAVVDVAVLLNGVNRLNLSSLFSPFSPFNSFSRLCLFSRLSLPSLFNSSSLLSPLSPSSQSNPFNPFNPSNLFNLFNKFSLFNPFNPSSLTNPFSPSSLFNRFNPSSLFNPFNPSSLFKPSSLFSLPSTFSLLSQLNPSSSSSLFRPLNRLIKSDLLVLA